LKCCFINQGRFINQGYSLSTNKHFQYKGEFNWVAF